MTGRRASASAPPGELRLLQRDTQDEPPPPQGLGVLRRAKQSRISTPWHALPRGGGTISAEGGHEIPNPPIPQQHPLLLPPKEGGRMFSRNLNPEISAGSPKGRGQGICTVGQGGGGHLVPRLLAEEDRQGGAGDQSRGGGEEGEGKGQHSRYGD